MKFDAKKGRNNSVADKVPNKVVKKAMNRSITIWCIFLLRWQVKLEVNQTTTDEMLHVFDDFDFVDGIKNGRDQFDSG